MNAQQRCNECLSACLIKTTKRFRLYLAEMVEIYISVVEWNLFLSVENRN